MKKRVMLTLFALVLFLGLSGTLIYGKSREVLEDKKPSESVLKEVVIGLEPSTNKVVPLRIEGEKNWDVNQGEKVDVLKGVTAKDHKNTKLTVKASPFSTEKVGKQEVLLTAEDKNKNKVTESIIVNVKEIEEPIVTEENEPEEMIVEQGESDVKVSDSNSELMYEEEENVTEPIIAEPIEEVTPAPEVVEPSWTANTLYVAGIQISYQNAGQASAQGIIDSNPNIVATWGGVVQQSGVDGANTHFIGHNPGIFNALFYLGGGSEIIVTDGAGIPTTYVVNQIVQVDDYATRVDNGQNISEEVIGAGGGERITLQTCVNDDINLIVMASAV